jgi:hypothetical protein
MRTIVFMMLIMATISATGSSRAETAQDRSLVSDGGRSLALVVESQLDAEDGTDSVVETAAVKRLAPVPARSEPAVVIDLSAVQTLAADVMVPEDWILDDRRLARTSYPGPSGPGWGAGLRVSVRLPSGWGRAEVAFFHSPLLGEDCNSRGYTVTADVLGSDHSPDPAFFLVGARRSYQPSRQELGWTRSALSRGRVQIRYELLLRTASVTRDVVDDIVMRSDEKDRSAVVQRTADRLKDYWGPRLGFVGSARLSGDARIDLSVGCFLAAVEESCPACDQVWQGVVAEKRTEWLPDAAVRLWIPLSDHLAVSGGYRWESWGRDSAGPLRSSGRFFTLSFLLGR